ncbi:MAG TPA: DUF255 domain-containing protein [Nitrospiria bacterium]
MIKNTESIHWKEWGEEAFQEAKETNKPVFLSISASWCHWCHVMDYESFSKPEVTRRITSDFIPIRIDSDKRPDINNRYNMGGWPTVAILNGRGKMIDGATYLPTPQLLHMLESNLERIKSSKPSSETPQQKPEPPNQHPNEEMVQAVAKSLERAFDRTFGGFGGPPKFPQPWALEFALFLNSKPGNPIWKEIIQLTLENMRGGIYDHVDGGFFRYATRGDWDKPHFEKLLDLNTRMLSLYLKAYQITGEATYRSTAQGILDYLFTTLALEGKPWLCGSQNADTHYYQLSDEDRMWAPPPQIDQTIFADHNAQAASSLLLTYQAFQKTEYKEKGLHLINQLWNHFFDPQKGMFHYDDGKLSLGGYLSDQVQMIHALLDGFETTGNREYFNRSEKLFSLMDDFLWDEKSGGYWDLPDHQKIGDSVHIRIKPFSENSIAAMALIRLFHFTKDKKYLHRAEATLSYLSTEFEHYKHHAAPFALALCYFLHPPHHMTIIGNKKDPKWQELVSSAHQIKSPWKVILPLDSKTDTKIIEQFGYKPNPTPQAYICVGEKCLPPVSGSDDLFQAFKDLA